MRQRNNFFVVTTSEMCVQLNEFLHSISPYMFPFVMEYSLIALSMTAIIYGSINSTMIDSFKNLKYIFTLRSSSVDSANKPVQSGKTRAHSKNDFDITSLDSWSFDSMTKHHSNVGAFLGGLMFAGVLACLIATALQGQVDDYKATITHLITDIMISSILLTACIVTLVSILKLPRVHRSASIDDILLMVAMSGSFVFQVSIMIPTVDIAHKDGWSSSTSLLLTSIIMAMLHSFVQTVLLLAATRSYSYTVKQGHQYPARQAITFLAFGNVITWIYRISRGMQQFPLDGSSDDLSFVFWLFLLHLTLPLLLFFYFHSSVCFADVWHSAYQPLTHRLQPCVISDEAYAKSRFLRDDTALSTSTMAEDYLTNSNDDKALA